MKRSASRGSGHRLVRARIDDEGREHPSNPENSRSGGNCEQDHIADRPLAGPRDVWFAVGETSNSGTYDGGTGHDRIVATADGTVIGIARENGLTSIEEIDGNGFANVKVGGTGSSDASST